MCVWYMQDAVWMLCTSAAIVFENTTTADITIIQLHTLSSDAVRQGEVQCRGQRAAGK